jgi:long-chain acyl-CoA synthetase
VNSRFLDQRVLEHASLRPESPAIGTPTGWHTYAQLADAVRLLAGSLHKRGVGPGTFVLNMLPSGIEAVAATLAIQHQGGCAVEVNAAWGPDLIAKIARSTGARHAFAHRRDAARLRACADAWKALWIADSSAAARLEELSVAELIAVDAQGRPVEPLCETRGAIRTDNDLATLLFTSATTSAPRGVRISYRNIAANTESIVEYLNLTRSDRVLSILPLSYSYGRSLLQTHLWVGGSIFFDHRFMYPRVVITALASEQCTGFAGVPLTFDVLRRQCDPTELSRTGLRYVTQAGGGMPQDLRLWVRHAFAPAEFYVMYGQTEATARLAYLPPEKLVDKAGAIGIPIPGVALRVVDDNGRELGVDEVGNLMAKGDNVCGGYFDAPEETDRILRDDWLWTGDLARRDSDGVFFLAGRVRTMLKISGHRFSPEEVEERLLQHQAVREACAVAAPDEVMGQSLAAFIVLDAPVDVSTLRRFCAEKLASFKVPKSFVVLSALPRSGAGKVLRAELEERAKNITQGIELPQ